METNQTGVETATLAGGCFWCIEAAFLDLRGVQRVESGYTGGQLENPTYEAVCGGRTGHAEVVQVDFDPAVISFGDLLDVFFTVHDPTTKDRQGADVGTQYRSAIFYHTDDQQRTAREVMARLEREGVWKGIVTELSPATTYYPAEAYHRDYYNRNTNQPYCRAVITPKIAKLRKYHMDKLR